jgi:hypothetical protein
MILFNISRLFRGKKHQPEVQKDESDSEPAFEEDQEVERQAMLSSPIKKGKRVTSDVHGHCHTIEPALNLLH